MGKVKDKEHLKLRGLVLKWAHINEINIISDIYYKSFICNIKQCVFRIFLAR